LTKRVFIYHVFSSINSVTSLPAARHFKKEPTETVAFCFGIPENTVFSSQLIMSL
jgi:hypothetical protein